jgi:G protein-coupled glucose receptor regulating Gpa2 C-term/G protein-coupled glucose receptor regulating Gpa2
LGKSPSVNENFSTLIATKCWVTSKYPDLRLWLHYFWIFTFEFGTVLIYIAMYIAIHYRIKSDYYAASSQQAQHARTAAKLMIVYPIIYVICTLPLATLRMISMASNSNLSFGWFCFAGAMITSNGWLDVFLYSMTRRIMLFSDDPPNTEAYGIETFAMPFSGPAFRRFGTQTTCEFAGDAKRPVGPTKWRRIPSHKGDLESQKSSVLVSYASTSNLCDGSSPLSVHPERFSGSTRSRSDTLSIAVKTTTTFEVRSEPIVELDDLREASAFRKDTNARSPSDKSEYDVEFATKPEGWPK